jgi:hypothetical protein
MPETKNGGEGLPKPKFHPLSAKKGKQRYTGSPRGKPSERGKSEVPKG